MENLKKRNVNFRTIEIGGFIIGLARQDWKNHSHFCAYVNLKNAKFLNDEILNHPTFREGDTIGYDSAHSYNESMTIDEKLIDVLGQVAEGIKAYNKIINKDL